MTELTIPRSPGDFTPEWLTRALRSRCSIAVSDVKSFRMETPDTGKGLGSEIVRLHLTYTVEREDLPDSLIAKFPSTNPETRALYAQIRSHQREIGFYQEVAGEIPLRTPRCYYSAFDSGTGDFLVLLEDLLPARMGDQAAGCSPEEAELAIGGLDGLHARCWKALDWTSTTGSRPGMDLPTITRRTTAGGGIWSCRGSKTWSRRGFRRWPS